ncbi:receptor-like protein kinase FERONIA [Gastrolobium bilobum]|uniref:receptor-like protein kinase FERONIA n=1 Tax=Gastrolobium bilobum TaxID=150636 RepID=UPI002AB081A7|nr:receptor-like protein kinase FERONIA [Gastrolobium bilobum]
MPSLLQQAPMANLKTHCVSFLILLSLQHFFPLHVTSHNPSPTPTSTKEPFKTSKKNTTIPIIASVAATTSFVALFIIGFLIFRCRRRASSRDRNPPEHSNTCRHFSIAEIRAATNNFNDGLIVGNGGFGNVYKGHIDKCHKPVAIKRLKPGSDQGAHEFQTEIRMLSHFRHPHLVSLIGYCNDGAEMIIVYDFMARGTLRDHLYGSGNRHHHPLSWNQRLDICLAAARGLNFLHAGVNKQSVIHRDVKSTNILLDEDWVAKVSDFGLSKVGPNMSHVTTDVKGSFGYLDPEYYMSLWLTQKSDVYSFGVVLLEVLCGRPPIKTRVDKHLEYLVAWFIKCCSEGKVDQTVDPALRGTIRPKCLKKFVEIALSCLHDHGKERPLMRDVVKGLEHALNLQHCWGQSGALVQGKGKSEEIAMSLTKVVGHEDFDEKLGRVLNESTSGKAKTTCVEEEQALVHGVLLQENGNDPQS